MTATQLQQYNGETLYQAISELWRRTLRAHDNISLDSLWREGSGSCRSDRLRELKAAYDAFDSEGNISLAPGLASPEGLERQHQETIIERASSPTLIDSIAVASGPQSAMKIKEPGTPSTAQNANPRMLKRKASTITEEIPPSDVSSPSIARHRSPVVYPSPPDLEKKTPSTQMPNDKPYRLSPKDVIQRLQVIRDLQLKQVQWMIDYFKLPRSPSPVTVTPEPNQLLAAPYRRCWGDEWRREGDLLLRQDKRSVFNDTMALISSFLFENILTRENGDGRFCTTVRPLEID